VVPDSSTATNEKSLQAEIARLNKVVKSLMDRAERSANVQDSDFNLFQTTVMLEDQVRRRTEELEAALRQNETINQALRETEQKYRGIFDDAIVGIFQTTPNGHFLSANPFLANMLGYDSPAEMITSISDMATQFYVEPGCRDDFRRRLDQGRGVHNYEFEVFRKDGSKIWVVASARAIFKNNTVVRYEGMMEDVTERRLLRSQLLQAQKLESVGQLAAGIAHEINTPVQFIGDNVRFLQGAFHDLKNILSDYEHLHEAAKSNLVSAKIVQEVTTAIERADIGYLLEEIPKAIDQTLEGVARVSTLMGAMKEFSHPGTKEKIPLDINHSIESTITIARNEWKYVADLETDYDKTLPQISCLPAEFNQVILNLIVNAAHAIADVVGKSGTTKGKITVQTRNCGEWAEIRIQDTGTGIPQEIQARVFDPFFTTKEVGKGTGQGLSIAHSVIVDKHEGSIHFETEEGKGTTFVVRLPYQGKSLVAHAQ
jgi:PAS domain S-box-containing protein